MRICVITVGDEPYHHTQREVFVRLARRDTVGEHSLESDPQRADALLVVDLQQHPRDPFLRALRSHDLVRSCPDKVYVYDERDLPFVTFPGVYVSGRGRSCRSSWMVGGPYPSLPNALLPAAEAPDLLYSFQGARTHPVREVVLTLRHPRSVIEDTTGVDFLAGGDPAADPQRQIARARYAEIIGRSKFVLCPRGHGSSTFRLYETLSAGRVPVVISDDWLPPPRVDWDRCVVRVAEKQAHLVPQLLERLEERWPLMVTAGQSAMAEHFTSSRLWHHYACSIAGLRRAPRAPTPWWTQPEVLRVGARTLRAARRSSR